ncbi:MAG: hypothetical protein SYNGOMJ08_00429 [Candidatus Syntrophoarchaeum sp. GoM_oil]|nr:MAG: hypothetical protein SYNGOMJ08_00429 [Candidatus Syntrophoarchaeum sp. GoM_oil]
MKKIGSLFVALCLLGLFIAPLAAAGECRVVVEDQRVTSHTVNLPVKIVDCENIGSCDLILTFNPSSFRVSEITEGDFDTTLWNRDDANAGRVRIGGFQTTSDGLDGDILVATISFSHIDEGSSPITLEVLTLKDATPACKEISYTIVNGRLFTGGSDYIGSRGYGDLPISTHSINTTKVTRLIPLIEASKECSVIFRDLVIAMITIITEEDLKDIALSVQGLDEKPPGTPLPDAIPYAYFEIGADGFDEADATAGINFHVLRSWIEENNIDERTITLNRYNGGWISLSTVKIDDAGEFIGFRADTTEFSYFAITGERMEAIAEADRSDTETAELAVAPISESAQPESLSWSYVLLAIIGTILVCGVIFLAISRRRK